MVQKALYMIKITTKSLTYKTTKLHCHPIEIENQARSKPF